MDFYLFYRKQNCGGNWLLHILATAVINCPFFCLFLRGFTNVLVLVKFCLFIVVLCSASFGGLVFFLCFVVAVVFVFQLCFHFYRKL